MAESRYLFILSCSRSGSTLLAMILGAHPMGVTVGEFASWPVVNSYPASPESYCNCGAKPFASCEFWQDVGKRAGVQTGWDPLQEPSRHWLSTQNMPRRMQAWIRVQEYLGLTSHSWQAIAQHTLPIYDAALEVAQGRFIVDSAKNAFRAKHIWQQRPDACRFLHLVRDGRGVLCSMLGRTEKQHAWHSSAASGTQCWKHNNERVERVMKCVPKEHQLFLRYEDFCQYPSEYLERICKLVDVAYTPKMLDFGRVRQHLVAGNRMRMNCTNEIRLDDHWKQALRPAELNTFEKIGGKLNRRLGYDAAS